MEIKEVKTVDEALLVLEDYKQFDRIILPNVTDYPQYTDRAILAIKIEASGLYVVVLDKTFEEIYEERRNQWGLKRNKPEDF